MKKILALFLMLILTGCVSNEDFSKTCKVNYKTTHMNDFTIMNIIYDSDDVVKEALITYRYEAIDDDGMATLSRVKEANRSYNYKYSDMDISMYVSKDTDHEFEVKYKIDVQKVNKDVLNDFKLKKNSVKLFNKLKEDNIECEAS